MSGCCLYCIHAQAYWIGSDGKKHLPPKQSFGDMNIYCHHPDKGAGIECYPISFARCSVFEQAGNEQIQRRRDFFSQFERCLHTLRSSLNGTLMFWKQHPKTQPNNTNPIRRDK